MKKWLAEDEWYPVYVVGDSGFGRECEFTDTEVERITAAFAEFDAVQTLICEAWWLAGKVPTLLTDPEDMKKPPTPSTQRVE